MGTRDPRVDAYIAKQKEFAKPILKQAMRLNDEGVVVPKPKWRSGRRTVLRLSFS